MRITVKSSPAVTSLFSTLSKLNQVFCMDDVHVTTVASVALAAK